MDEFNYWDPNVSPDELDQYEDAVNAIPPGQCDGDIDELFCPEEGDYDF